LLDESKYPAEFVYGETATALAWANDPEVRSQLMENFLWSAAKISAEQPMPLQPLLHVGFEIVKDPAMTEGPWVEMLARVIDEGVAKMVESGADVNQADAYLQRWRYSLAKHRGATPEELRDAINGQAGNLLRADPEDKATVQNFFGTMKHSEVTVMYRDLMLRQFAEEYAEEGDFGAARLMLADISDANDRLRVIKNCAAKATTSEQIDVLYPGKQIAGDVDKNWETDLAVYLAKVELSGDSRLLIQAAVRCAETISDEGSMPSSAATKPVFIRVAHRLLNERDPRQAAVLARQVLPHLRAANVADITPAYFADLSRTLIRSGDTEEPARAYRHIKHYASQPQAPAGSEVLNLWELARMLR
jgi:Rod binding domain-containing protein